VRRQCPLCQSTESTVLTTRDRNGVGLTTAQCDVCGLAFSNPFLTQADLDAFYARAYRGGTKGHREPSDLIKARPWMHDRARYFAELLMPWMGASYLDVGCGEGSLVIELRRRLHNLTIDVVEPDDAYRQFAMAKAGARGYRSMSQYAPETQKPAVVSMIHVLEHLLDPVAQLREIRAVMAADGMICIDVPDVAQYHSLSDLHLSHCTHFSADHLRVALAIAGYEVLDLKAHAPPHLPPSLFVVARPRDGGSESPVWPVEAKGPVRAGIAGADQSLMRYVLSKLC
jgi:SAM-dependent methyltransferase